MSEMKPYIVRQGDFIDKVCFLSGQNAADVWNHPKNDLLKRERRDPSVLLPGDVAMVSNAPMVKGHIAIEQENRFVATVPEVEVNVQFFDDSGRPLVGADASVEWAGSSRHHQTDGGGFLRIRVPMTCTFVYVAFPDSQQYYCLQVGFLDPASTPSGSRQRLENLGVFGDIGQSYRVTEEFSLSQFNEADPAGESLRHELGSETMQEAAARLHSR